LLGAVTKQGFLASDRRRRFWRRSEDSFCNSAEQSDAIELAVAQKNDLASFWQAGRDLLEQLLVEGVGEMAFLAVTTIQPRGRARF